MDINKMMTNEHCLCKRSTNKDFSRGLLNYGNTATEDLNKNPEKETTYRNRSKYKTDCHQHLRIKCVCVPIISSVYHRIDLLDACICYKKKRLI